MEDIRIRRAGSRDLDDILSIEDESFDSAVRESPETFRERLEVFPEGFVVLERLGGVGGYLCSELWDLPGLPAPSDFTLGHSARDRHAPRGRTLYISSYGIRESLRGRGLGKHLFRGFLDLAGRTFPFDDVILLVSAAWTGARAIYEAEGFSHILSIPAFFRFSDGSSADGEVLRRPRVRGSTGTPSAPMMKDKELP